MNSPATVANHTASGVTLDHLDSRTQQLIDRLNELVLGIEVAAVCLMGGEKPGTKDTLPPPLRAYDHQGGWLAGHEAQLAQMEGSLGYAREMVERIYHRTVAAAVEPEMRGGR